MAPAAESIKASIHSPSFGSRRRTSPRWCGWNGAEALRRGGAERGLQGHTTIDTRLQAPRRTAPLRLGLVEFDRRHGWRGARRTRRTEGATRTRRSWRRSSRNTRASACSSRRWWSRSRTARRGVPAAGAARIDWDGLSWARRENDLRTGPEAEGRRAVLARGDVVRVIRAWRRRAAGAGAGGRVRLVALGRTTAPIAALVGGFELLRQGLRQVQPRHAGEAAAGSGFKPFRIRRRWRTASRPRR